MKRFALNTARDLAEPAIIEALEKAGFHVWQKLPVDLLTYRPDKGLQMLEVKTPNAKGKRRPRAYEKAQNEIIALTHTSVALTPAEALQALGAVPNLNVAVMLEAQRIFNEECLVWRNADYKYIKGT